MRTAGLALIAVLCWAVPAAAQSDKRVRPRAGTECSIDSLTPVAFGGYDTDASEALASSGRLRFNCRPWRLLTVKITIGPSNVSGSIADSRMREFGGSDQLRYNLFQDARGTILWGDGFHGGQPLFVTGFINFTVDIHGRAPPTQNVREGEYFDSVRVTIMP